MSSDHKKKDFSKLIVISAIIAVVGYTAVHLFFVWHHRVIPPQLTISWFTFWGVELGYLAGMKVKERFDRFRGFSSHNEVNTEISPYDKGGGK